jgi:hypothetical protein
MRGINFNTQIILTLSTTRLFQTIQSMGSFEQFTRIKRLNLWKNLWKIGETFGSEQKGTGQKILFRYFTKLVSARVYAIYLKKIFFNIKKDKYQKKGNSSCSFHMDSTTGRKN